MCRHYICITMKEDGPITMNTIKALLPLATSVVMVVLSWGSLNSKVDLTIQKLDTIAQAVNEIKTDRKESIAQMREKVDERDKMIAQISEEIARIKTIINYKGN